MREARQIVTLTEEKRVFLDFGEGQNFLQKGQPSTQFSAERMGECEPHARQDRLRLRVRIRSDLPSEFDRPLRSPFQRHRRIALNRRKRPQESGFGGAAPVHRGF